MSELIVYIRGMRFFGGQIVTYPTLYQLKQWWPDSKLIVVGKDPVGGHCTSLPWVDDFVQADRPWQKSKVINRKRHLMAVLHYSSELYGLIGCLKRPPLRLGFKNKRLSDFAWTHSWVKNRQEYLGLANLNLLSSYRPLQPEQVAYTCFSALAKNVVTPPELADVVLMPGGGAGAYKRWDIGNYVALADLLKAELGAHTTFSFVLGPDEMAEYATLQRLNRPDFRYLIGRPVPEIASLCLQARLVVANDCGPSHVAQGTCVPYVGVFHGPNPEWYWDRDYSAIVVPTLDNAEIINSISPEKVAHACKQVLSAKRFELSGG
jgi:ADP-heptose:LPS heptosyltransferase